MKKIFVDTGAWYALIDRRDPNHDRVVPVFEEFKSRLVTSNFVVDETLTLLRYRLGWQIAYTFGEKVRSNTLAHTIRIQSADEQSAWDIFVRYQDHSFSFTDCTSFAVVERAKITVSLALDDDFRSYGLHCLPMMH